MAKYKEVFLDFIALLIFLFIELGLISLCIVGIGYDWIKEKVKR